MKILVSLFYAYSITILGQVFIATTGGVEVKVYEVENNSYTTLGGLLVKEPDETTRKKVYAISGENTKTVQQALKHAESSDSTDLLLDFLSFKTIKDVSSALVSPKSFSFEVNASTSVTKGQIYFINVKHENVFKRLRGVRAERKDNDKLVWCIYPVSGWKVLRQLRKNTFANRALASLDMALGTNDVFVQEKGGDNNWIKLVDSTKEKLTLPSGQISISLKCVEARPVMFKRLQRLGLRVVNPTLKLSICPDDYYACQIMQSVFSAQINKILDPNRISFFHNVWSLTGTNGNPLPVTLLACMDKEIRVLIPEEQKTNGSQPGWASLQTGDEPVDAKYSLQMGSQNQQELTREIHIDLKKIKHSEDGRYDIVPFQYADSESK